MYIKLDTNAVINSKDIVGIFDIEKITVFKVNREYLSINEKSGKIINTTSELPKSFIVCEKGGQKSRDGSQKTDIGNRAAEVRQVRQVLDGKDHEGNIQCPGGYRSFQKPISAGTSSGTWPCQAWRRQSFGKAAYRSR